MGRCTIIRNSIVLSAVVLLLLVAATSNAQNSILSLGKPVVQDGNVVLDVELSDFFDKESLASLQSGMPASLVFDWSIYMHREAWSDPQIATGQIRNRIYFDVLEEKYHLFNHQGRPLGACDALTGVSQALCQKKAMVLSDVDGLKSGVQYYVKMEASLEILNDQQVRGFEEWLWGEERGGGDSQGEDSVDRLVSQEEDSGFSSGLSDMALGLVLKVTGISDSTVTGQSALFYGEP